MGDFADMAIEESLNAWEYMELHPEEFHWTDLDGGFFRQTKRHRRRKDRRRHTGSMRECQFCGKFPLFFHEYEENKWMLAEWNEENKPIRHVCKLKERFNRVRSSY